MTIHSRRHRKRNSAAEKVKEEAGETINSAVTATVMRGASAIKRNMETIKRSGINERAKKINPGKGRRSKKTENRR